MSKKKNEEIEDKSWIPVLKGTTYCSPACGGGCRKKDYDRAVRDANRLVEQLEGPTWKAEIWENLGWHFQAVSGPVQVYGNRHSRDKKLRYHCLISDRASCASGGSIIWTDQAPHDLYDDPNEAVEVMFKSALSETSRVVNAGYAAYVAAGGSGQGLMPLATVLIPRLAQLIQDT